jgi:hypothetical protein
MSVRLEWKPQNCWIGAFWKKTELENRDGDRVRFDLWICLLPMLPFHFVWTRDQEEKG